MNKTVRKYGDYVATIMNKEYEDTMAIIKKEFKTIDNMVFSIVVSDEIETQEKIAKTIEITDNFRNSMEKMIGARMEKIIVEKRPILINKMADLSCEQDNIIEGIMLLEPLMKVTDLAFETYLELTIGYVSKRLFQLIDAVEETLEDEDEEVEEIEIDLEELLKAVLKSTLKKD